MKIVDYKEPKLYKDKDNKKWFILYSVKYDGADKWTPQKEYGKNYTLDRKSLNSIADLKKREVEFIKVMGALEHHLKAGISIKVPETVKVAVEERIKESKKKAFDENFTSYFVAKGFFKPIPKKERSSQQFKGFFMNQFRPYLKKKGFLNDLSLVTKADLNEFMNIYYQSTDPKVKWSNTTWVNKKGMLGSFFQYLVDEDILMDNPVKKVKSKKKEATERFKIFSKEERELLFNHLDSGDFPFLASIAKTIYYAYIRSSELTRLKVSDFSIEKRTIRIAANNAKSQNDNQIKWVKMTPQLTESISTYLSKFEHQPDWYMFGKGFKPSPYRSSDYWQIQFRREYKDLKLKHPDKFTDEGQTMYSLKHSGITDFYYSNLDKYPVATLLRTIQLQARHETQEMTQRYMKKLEIDIDVFDEFVFD